MNEATQAPAPEQGRPADATLDAAVAAELESMGQTDENILDDADGTADEAQQADEQQNDADAQDDGEGDGQEVAPDESEYEFNGKKYKVPRELIDGNLRMQDYTQKTMALAERFRAADARDQVVAQLYQQGQHVQAQRAKLTNIDMAINQGYAYLSQNANLSIADPVEFSRLTGQLSLLQHQRAQTVQELDQTDNQFRQYQARVDQERVQRVMPHFQQMGLDGAALQRVGSYAAAHGATPEEMQYLHAANSPWAIVALEKARRYDELMGQKAQATQKVNKARQAQVLRPGSSSTQQRGTKVDGYAKRLGATGTTKDAVALELALMERRGGGARRS